MLINSIKVNGELYINGLSHIIFFPVDYEASIKSGLIFNSLDILKQIKPSQDNDDIDNPLINACTNTTGQVILEISIVTLERINTIGLEVFLKNDKYFNFTITKLFDTFTEEVQNQYFVYKVKAEVHSAIFENLYNSYCNGEEVKIIIKSLYNMEDCYL